jgi:YD repeat-containing protein
MGYNYSPYIIGMLLFPSPLITASDSFDDAPGISLAFNRTFYQSVAERYNLGGFGRGWSSQWDLRAETNAQGDVIIRSIGDRQRQFLRQTDGTFKEGGSGASLTLVSGQYRLKEANGLISLFGTDGKLSYVEDTNANCITLQYTNNRLTQLAHSNGNSLALTYNAQGRIASATDSEARITNYNYDPTGEYLLSVVDPTGTTTYTYDTGNIAGKKNSLLSITSDLGYQRNFEYDNQGRLIKESSNGQAQTLTYTYDNVGTVRVTDSNNIGSVPIL